MSLLGVYFGQKSVHLTETKGKKILNILKIDRQQYSEDELGERIPEDLKIVALCQEEFRKNKITVKEANLALSGQDLIVRNFEMPAMPRQELESAVEFEARKYLPFKIEDLIWDYQAKYHRLTRKNYILFMGIKKESHQKYRSIFNQLNIRLNRIEYAPFSMLNLLKFSGLPQKGIVCLVLAGIKELDEVNFLVLEDGFPLFSRDINLITRAMVSEKAPAEETEILAKLTSEIRISLDYYQRRFPQQKINEIFFCVEDEYRLNLETLIKESALKAHFINLLKYLGKNSSYNMGLLKAYGAALSKIVKTNISINLLTEKEEKIISIPKESLAKELVSSLSGLRISGFVLFFSALICAFPFFYLKFYQAKPLKEKINFLISQRPQVSTVNPQADYETLVSAQSAYKDKLTAVDNLIQREFYFTKILDAIPRLTPKNLWLTDLSYRDTDERRELSLSGLAYLADSAKEMDLVNSFIFGLKTNAVFTRNFKEINLVSIDTTKEDSKSVTRFNIICRSLTKKR